MKIRPDSIKRIVALANQSPSGDNCQPWKFTWNGAILSISHNAERAAHALNPSNFASVLTLGCLWESLELAAASEGFTCRLQATDAAGGVSTEPWLNCEFLADGFSKSNAKATIERRQTDRRHFKSIPLTADCRTTLLSTVSKNLDGFNLHLSDQSPGRDWTNCLASLDLAIFSSEDVHRDLFQWLRLAQNTSAIPDGMPWETLGLSRLELPIMRLTKSFRAQMLLNRLGGKYMIKARTKSLLQATGTFGLFTIENFNTDNLIKVGRAFMRCWFSLNDAGISFQPLTLGSLASHPYISELSREMWNKAKYKPDFAEMRRLHQKQFHLKQTESPIWMFRAGEPINSQPPPRCHRFPVDSILQIIE